MENQGMEFNTQEFVEQMALIVNLQLRDEYKDGVVDNFEKIRAIAKIVNEFELESTVEISTVFLHD
ncbi:MAG: DUF4089 domain-containing protein [Calothrix sp. SM1_7_51]|nr:DUF4089 domain-containing protein [Calothrix sp. SM1_7_51]